MNDELVEVIERPYLNDPILVVMLQGWIDASGAALMAMSALESQTNAKPIARFDRDTFIDYRARRPVMELRDGVNVRLVWPDIELKHGTDKAGHDVLLLTGHEPDTAWHRFADLATGLGVELGVRTMVGLGAYPFAAPHSRPARLSCTAPDEQMLVDVPFQKSSIDVPAGMESVLEHSFHARGVPAIGVWVQVPHYVSGMAYPSASVALLSGVEDITGVTVDTSALRAEALLQRAKLDELVAGNEEHESMLRQLEQIYDAQLAPEEPLSQHPSVARTIDPAELPSVDELAAEVERFLRDQGDQ